MNKWKDKVKRYGDPEIESSEVIFGVYRLTVHRHIDYAADTWLASCYPGLFRAIKLDSKYLNKAKRQAKARLETILEKALNEIRCSEQ